MKRLLTYFISLMSLTSACGNHNFRDANVAEFANLIDSPNVVLLDVRSIDEFNEGHIEGAICIDQNLDDFMDKVKNEIEPTKTIAVYCRSGRRSANAATRMSNEGYNCVNLIGGIIAWKASNMPIVTQSYEIDVFKTKSGKSIKFHTLMHASIRMQIDSIEVEIDPVAKLGDRTVDYSLMPKADLLLVTHEHSDHFDKATLSLLSNSKTQLLTNKRCAQLYGCGKIMENGDKMEINEGITVEAVPAYNITEGHQQFHPKGRDNGYIITVDGFRVYIAGDTEDITELNNVADIDVAFMPCNQPYTMTPEQLVKAACIVKPKVLFPYHYGQTNVSNIPKMLKDKGIDVRIRHYE